jgi:hypothetical protein
VLKKEVIALRAQAENAENFKRDERDEVMWAEQQKALEIAKNSAEIVSGQNK